MWEWTDAWILQSIADAGRKPDLSRVIGAADHFNVDIPSRETMVSSVNRLAAAALVEPLENRLVVSRRGRQLVRQSARFTEGVRATAPRLLARLREDVPFPTDLSDERWSLSPAEWQAAYARYRSRTM